MPSAMCNLRIIEIAPSLPRNKSRDYGDFHPVIPPLKCPDICPNRTRT